MKKLLVFVFLISSTAQAKRITLDIPDRDIAIVENDVTDAEEWIKDAWAGKVSKCKERLIKGEINQSVKEGSAIPANEAAIVTKAFSRPEYKNRKQRDAEEERIRQERLKAINAQ